MLASNLVRTVAYVICVLGVAWLGFGSLQFRRSLRTSLTAAYSQLNAVDPNSSGGSGKVLNSYYESVYDSLPHTFLPAALIIFGSTLLLIRKKGKGV
jgi:hypothetical protein